MIPEILYLAFTAAGAFSLGNFALERFHKTESKLEAFLASSAFGFIIISSAMLLLGIPGLYATAVFAAFNALLLLLTILKAGKLLATARHSLELMKEPSRITKGAFAAFIAFAALNLIAASAPPTSADGLLHHLTAPKLWLEQGSLANLPSLQAMTEAPMSINMIYLHGLQLLNGKLAQMTAWYLSFLAALAVFLITARLATKQAAITAATLFSTLPIFSVFSARPYVDIPMAFFALLAAFFFLKCAEKPSWKMAAMTGLFLGMAVSAKNTGILMAAAFAGLAALSFISTPWEYKGALARNAIIATAITAMLLSPWLIKSYANTEDPLHPLLFKYTGGTNWNNEHERMLLEFHRAHGIGFSPILLPLFPLELTIHPQRFADSAGITPLFLGLLPLLILVKKPRKIKLLLALAATLLTIQFFTAQQTRYMFLLWGIMSAITAFTIDSFKPHKIAHMGLYALVAGSLIINGALWAAANLDDVPVAAGLQTEKEYLTKKVPTYAATEFLATADKNALVCWYGDGRGFWAKNPYVWCHPIYQGYVDFTEIATSQQLSERLRQLNITYILYEKKMGGQPLYGDRKTFSDETTEYFLKSDSLMKQYLAEHGQKAYEDQNAEIYSITFLR